MPFPEKQTNTSHYCRYRHALWMLWLIFSRPFSRIIKEVSSFKTVYCTSELRHHIQVLHKNGSATPRAVGKEVQCIAYLGMA